RIIGTENVHRYVERNNVTIVNNTTIINNINANNTAANRGNNSGRYNRGPNVNEIENITNTKIQPVTINVNNTPGRTSVNNNRINVYRPDLNRNASQGNNKPVPQKVFQYNQGNNQNPNQQQNGRRGNYQNPNQQPVRPVNGQGN
ncbi:MAG TPA: hypothetical protein DCO83_06735, partial [Mucilaginibacter sp.]|nr:hypothetical protein [Mucilaginibacter sp.]